MWGDVAAWRRHRAWRRMGVGVRWYEGITGRVDSRDERRYGLLWRSRKWRSRRGQRSLSPLYTVSRYLITAGKLRMVGDDYSIFCVCLLFNTVFNLVHRPPFVVCCRVHTQNLYGERDVQTHIVCAAFLPFFSLRIAPSPPPSCLPSSFWPSSSERSRCLLLR
jgi:hypothetical protein